MIKRIQECITEAKKLAALPNPNPDLPGIIGCLEAMEKGEEKESGAKSRLAGALGRLVMEDGSFSESRFGLKLLKLADDFVETN